MGHMVVSTGYRRGLAAGLVLAGLPGLLGLDAARAEAPFTPLDAAIVLGAIALAWGLLSALPGALGGYLTGGRAGIKGGALRGAVAGPLLWFLKFSYPLALAGAGLAGAYGHVLWRKLRRRPVPAPPAGQDHD